MKSTEDAIKESVEINRRKLRKKLLIILILAVATVITFLISVAFGAYKLPVSEVFKTIFMHEEGLNRTIIWNVRVPRCLVCILVGVCLSLSGTTLQGIMGNSLASPSTIGVTAGAGLMTTVCVVLLPSMVALQTPLAFVGALITAVIIYFSSWKNGRIRVERMVLIGVAVTSFTNAIVNTIFIFYPDRVQSTLGFNIGSLAAKSWIHFYMLLPYAVIGFIICLLMARRMNVMTLGDEIAASLGVNVELERMVFIAISALLAASAVSTVGMLGFVGLIVPHIARYFMGSDYRFLYPAVALLGAVFMLICDTASRLIFAPAEIPVGIILAVIGAPFFLYLMKRGGN